MQGAADCVPYPDRVPTNVVEDGRRVASGPDVDAISLSRSSRPMAAIFPTDRPVKRGGISDVPRAFPSRDTLRRTYERNEHGSVLRPTQRT